MRIARRQFTSRYLLSPTKTYRFPILQRRLAAAGARCASARTSFRGEIDTKLVTHLKQAQRDVRAQTSCLVVAAAYPPFHGIVRIPVSFSFIHGDFIQGEGCSDNVCREL